MALREPGHLLYIMGGLYPKGKSCLLPIICVVKCSKHMGPLGNSQTEGCCSPGVERIKSEKRLGSKTIHARRRQARNREQEPSQGCALVEVREWEWPRSALGVSYQGV